MTDYVAAWDRPFVVLVKEDSWPKVFRPSLTSNFYNSLSMSNTVRPWMATKKWHFGDLVVYEGQRCRPVEFTNDHDAIEFKLRFL